MAGIGNAMVNEGQLTASLRHSFGSDNDRTNQDNRWRSRIMADYGVTDDYAVGLFLQGDRRDHKNMEVESTIFEQRFEFAEVKSHGYYTGVRLRYTHRDNDKRPNNAHVRLIFGLPVQQWEFRYNQIIAHDVGPDAVSGLALDTRFQVTYGYWGSHRVGLESFSDMGRFRDGNTFDEQSHVLGAVFTGKLSETWGYEAGYQRGVSLAAPDHTVKLFLFRTF